MSVPSHQPTKRRGDVLWQGLNSLRVSRAVGGNVRNESSPRTFGLGKGCRLRHALVKGIEDGVFPRYVPFIKGCFGDLYRPSNVTVVVGSAEKSPTCGGLRMRSLDFDASHLSLIDPLPLDGWIVEEVLKTQKAKVNQRIVVPFLDPRRTVTKVMCGHGDISVVMDNQLFIGGDTHIKLDAVKQLNRMLQTRKGVFGRLFPRRPSLHASSFMCITLKVCPASKPHENCSEHVVMPERIKPRFIASDAWTLMKS